MSSGAEVGIIAAAAASSRMNAIKAFGVIVRVRADTFNAILQKQDAPLVVISDCLFGSSKKYLTSYKGLTFFCKTNQTIQFPSNSEKITSDSISVPYA
jgi:hypothetical protein